MAMRRLSSHPQDAFAKIQADFAQQGSVWRGSGRQLWVADPALARAILANRDKRFVDTSDFFHTRRGLFGPRRAQIDIGRAARNLLRRELAARRPELPGLVAARLTGETDWPDAANLLIYEHLRTALLAPDSSPDLAALLDRLITRAVLAGARDRHSRLSRLRFRRTVMAALTDEIARRAADRKDSPADLLDVVAMHAQQSTTSAELADLAEVYLSFVFATVGSVGFALAWAMYLLGTHPEALGCEPGWIVRESLRLWPVAWLFGRQLARSIDIAGHQLDSRSTVTVCTYLAHRQPANGEDADRFRPQRWAAAPEPVSLAFGYGQHSCAGSQQALNLLEDVLTVLVRAQRFSVTPVGNGPQLGAALAPPKFLLRLDPVAV